MAQVQLSPNSWLNLTSLLEFNATSSDSAMATVGLGNGVTTVFNFANQFAPVVPKSVFINAGTIQANDDGDGTIVGLGVASGSTINYTTGALRLVFVTAPGVGTTITEAYTYDVQATIVFWDQTDYPQVPFSNN